MSEAFSEGSSPEEVSVQPDPQAPSVTLDYFRGKAAEFQALLGNLDRVGSQIELMLVDGIDDAQLRNDLTERWQELQARKGALKTTAETINLAIGTANLEIPKLSLPSTLGAVPVIVGAAAAAAVAGVAALITWGYGWISGVNARLRQAQLLEGLSPADRAKVAQTLAQTELAQAEAGASPIQSLAGVVKWLAIAALGYFAFQAFQQMGDA
jgi:hypothetical protein